MLRAMTKLDREHKDYLARHRDAARRRLLAWFETAARDLPWRHDRTPYRIWVAEVMLQQTQVETARAYYPRFLAAFPTLAALASASQEAVLKAWEGLGYYRRARALHAAAREVMAAHGGALPRDVAALRALPGIGAYTAGAIASLAFGIPAPAIDGNARRVLARVLAIASPTPAQLDAAARAWLPEDAAGPFNEALMELGATLCRPRSPLCEACPWRDLCRAHQRAAVDDFPAPRPRRELPHFDVAAAVTLRDDGRILVAQRRPEAMLGGLWEFPGGKREAGETLPQALRRELQEEMAIEVAVGEQLIQVRHAYTHFRITLYAFACRLEAGTPQCVECADFCWATLDEIRALPMAVTDRKIARAVETWLKAAQSSGG